MLTLANLAGVKLMSHPPHCPSWRRDREAYWWNIHCTNKACHHGLVWISRRDSEGGSYTVQCEQCSDYLYKQPAVIEYQNKVQAICQNAFAWGSRMQAEFSKRVWHELLGDKRGQQLHDKEITDAFKSLRADEIWKEVLAEGPAKPEDLTPAVFPEGWAELEPEKKKRKPKRVTLVET
jgi:hypothetical protein